MDAKPPSENSQTSDEYAITVRQFIDQGYADKIVRGECRVVWHHDPPAEDASEKSQAFYRRKLEVYGTSEWVESAEQIDHNEFYVRTAGNPTLWATGGSQIFYVTPIVP